MVGKIEQAYLKKPAAAGKPKRGVRTMIRTVPGSGPVVDR
jgi:hypothetical protein